MSPSAAELLGSPAAGDLVAAAVPQAEAVPDISSGSHVVSPVDSPSDELLLARFLKGGLGARDALGALAARHEHQLLGLAGALTGHRDLALEAVQDTWLKVIKYGRSFKSGSTVKTWLYRVLINACKDARAKSSRYRFSKSPESHGTQNSLDADQLPATDLPDSADLSRVRSAVDHLTGDQRLLILLCYHNGLTHPQAAQVLDIPLGTLKSRLNTILNTLRDNLKGPLA